VSVAPEVSLSVLKTELEAVAAYASASALPMDCGLLSQENLRFVVQFEDCNGEPFYAEFECSDYPLYPPTIEFVNKGRTQRGARNLYPQGFHTTPCVCMRYNRKAYSERGGPHGDWRLLDWRLPSGNAIGVDSLVLMVSDLHSKIRHGSGRML
jgi:hypothetical protein